MSQLRIAYVSVPDARSPLTWSGIPYHIGLALEKAGAALTHISPLPGPRGGAQAMLTHAATRMKQAGYRLFKRRYQYDRDPGMVGLWNAQAAEKLRGTNCDIVFSPSSIPVCLLKVKPPIVYWTDATFANLLDFYTDASRQAAASLANGHFFEQAALSNCARAAYSSAWATQSARDYYHAAPAKLAVLPLGANLSEIPPRDEVRAQLKRRGRKTCELLFMGVDWRRKGGDWAVETVEALARQGLNCTLTVAGCEPPQPHPRVRSVGFVSKHSAEGRARIRELLMRAHFLVLPSRADCTPCVIPEANAFGVPVLATAVGGIPSQVGAGRNGFLFSLAARGDEYAAKIAELFQDYQRYEAVASSSRDEYDERLNWDVSCRKLLELFQSLL